MYVIFAPLTRDKNHMVSQMAHAKNLGEPFMAHLENFYNIPCKVMHYFNGNHCSIILDYAYSSLET